MNKIIKKIAKHETEEVPLAKPITTLYKVKVHAGIIEDYRGKRNNNDNNISGNHDS